MACTFTMWQSVVSMFIQTLLCIYFLYCNVLKNTTAVSVHHHLILTNNGCGGYMYENNQVVATNNRFMEGLIQNIIKGKSYKRAINIFWTHNRKYRSRTQTQNIQIAHEPQFKLAYLMFNSKDMSSLSQSLYRTNREKFKDTRITEGFPIKSDQQRDGQPLQGTSTQVSRSKSIGTSLYIFWNIFAEWAADLSLQPFSLRVFYYIE